jgi:hypothetical protein
MIIWGGFSVNYENTGGRYNPTSDSWVATCTDIGQNPSARIGHSAVWTGQMIVWGARTAQQTT